MFNNADRQLLQKAIIALSDVKELLAVHPQLVQMNSSIEELKELVKGLVTSGMTEEEVAEFTTKLREQLGRLQEIK